MKSLVRCGLWLMPVLLLTACFHRSHRPQSQSLAPALLTPLLPPIPTTQSPPPVLADADFPATLSPLPEQSIRRIHHHHRPVVHEPQQQADTDTPGVSAIGQLSTGDTTDLRGQTVSSIADVEHSLNGINRPLGWQEQRTAAQVREFIKQARAALNSGDVDGAHTLAVKAKVLLNELNP